MLKKIFGEFMKIFLEGLNPLKFKEKFKFESVLKYITRILFGIWSWSNWGSCSSYSNEASCKVWKNLDLGRHWIWICKFELILNIGKSFNWAEPIGQRPKKTLIGQLGTRSHVALHGAGHQAVTVLTAKRPPAPVTAGHRRSTWASDYITMRGQAEGEPRFVCASSHPRCSCLRSCFRRFALHRPTADAAVLAAALGPWPPHRAASSSPCEAAGPGAPASSRADESPPTKQPLDAGRRPTLSSQANATKGFYELHRSSNARTPPPVTTHTPCCRNLPPARHSAVTHLPRWAKRRRRPQIGFPLSRASSLAPPCLDVRRRPAGIGRWATGANGDCTPLFPLPVGRKVLAGQATS
jgi:hypothetical protein